MVTISVRKVHLILLALPILALVLLACSQKEQSAWVGGSFKLGEVPSDVCVVNSLPVIINATTESDGDFNLVYLRKNGDIVIRHWAKGKLVPSNMYEKGEFYWTGSTCPESTDKKR